MYYVLMSFPSLLFVYEIFFICFVPNQIFRVYLIELRELMLLRHLSLDFPLCYDTLLIVTIRKKERKKKNNPLNDKLSTP